ncbi:MULTISPECIES: AraC family transcriptional regulator [Nocardioides]|uniref:AraC family transcriptional regulator n=1 Tax=Nocardioides vastitatis TaxID=2568655 RepID=A0ABW0ZKH2_9ACTN|nr:AraC family transcriptional regulator [Nocardioides sp.]THJ16043.1 AraC family transcriptional regulator [Nocardioides sp.]
MRDNDVPIRASILRGLPTLITRFGGPGEEFLAAYGIGGPVVEQHDTYVSLRLVERVLEEAARRFDVPDLGLQMAAQQDLHILGPLAIAMENSRTIGEALECANRFLFVVSPALSHEVIPDPLDNPGVLAIRYASTTGTASPQSIDYGLGMVHRAVTLVQGGGSYGLRSVQLPHPRLAPEAAYREHFGAEVAFDAPHAVLRMPRQLLAVPVIGGNDLLRDIAVDFLETHFGHEDVPVSDLVTAILEGQLGPDRPNLAKVARLLSLHPRSLQRLLADEGIAFKELLGRAQREQARKLITTTNLSFSQIAVQVGLREQSSLTRATRRWFGMSPSRLRRAASDSSGMS